VGVAAFAVALFILAIIALMKGRVVGGVFLVTQPKGRFGGSPKPAREARALPKRNQRD